MDCVIYVRWSSAEQAKGSSLARQLQDCRRYAISKSWNVAAELVDDGVSAWTGSNVSTGKLAGFVADLEAGEYPAGVVLLTEKLDRLSRQSARSSMALIDRIVDAGAIVATVDGGRSYDRNMDTLALLEVLIKSATANEESAKKSDRGLASWRLKRDRAVAGDKSPMTRRIPAWLAVEDSRIVAAEERGAVVRRIFQDTASGLGKAHIAKNLNAENVPCFGRGDGWHKSYVQKILNNRAVLGEFQPGQKARGAGRVLVGEPIADYYPPVVDAALWSRAHAAMSSRSRAAAGPGRSLVNLFAGLAYCGCGAKMSFRSKGQKVAANGEVRREDYLICDARQRGRGCGNATHFNYVHLESAVLDSVLDLALGDAHFSAPADARVLESKIAALDLRAADLRRSASRALKAYATEDDADAEALWRDLKAQAIELEQQKPSLERALVVARGAVSPAEHVQRIGHVRGQLDAHDEAVRFKARSLVKSALSDLVRRMRFGDGRFEVELNASAIAFAPTKGGFVVDRVSGTSDVDVINK